MWLNERKLQKKVVTMLRRVGKVQQIKVFKGVFQAKLIRDGFDHTKIRLCNNEITSQSYSEIEEKWKNNHKNGEIETLSMWRNRWFFLLKQHI